MTPHYTDDLVTVHHGDCLDVLREMSDASVDAVVTDPPYGLGFMGREWDDLPPGLPFAAECLRVLKPGGHLLAFGGSRTWHRLAVAVEDAGFEVRDSIAWLYGSGFPKSLDVSKAIDKMDATDLRRARALHFTAWMRSTGITAAQINAATGTFMGGHYLTQREQAAVAVADLFDRIRPLLPEVPEDIEQLVRERTVESENMKARPVVGERTTGIGTGRGAVSYISDSDNRDITAPHTEDAKAWHGWGTALKPAYEPIVVGRKPLIGTVAANVLAHGTGALNIDACRTATTDTLSGLGTPPLQFGGMNHRPFHDRHREGEASAERRYTDAGGTNFAATPGPRGGDDRGRWPTNVVLDDSQAAELDAQTGVLTSGANPTRRGADGDRTVLGAFAGQETAQAARGADAGGASRFFPIFRYEAKAPTDERPRDGAVAHPTVKPLDLMRWLVRLVTPPGGLVLDPFAGSGTTAEACVIEGFRCITVEREATYLPLIVARLSKPIQPDLFGGAA